MATGDTTRRLDVVGLGINPWWHATRRSTEIIAAADEVLYLVDDVLAERWVRRLNPASRPLATEYERFEQRSEVYDSIVATIMARLRNGGRICAAYYGHPGVFVDPGHAVIEAARAEGIAATMHPGISSADCLYADVGLDPGSRGCQSYEATAFLARDLSRFDATVDLILWQAGAVGEATTQPRRPPRLLAPLVRLLESIYGEDHVVTIYEAATQPAFESRLDRLPLRELAGADLELHSTLYVPPLSQGSAKSSSPTS